MSFYHKYRPQKFEDLVGQEHVQKTLASAVRDHKIGHAYLFSGPRGVGKTTVARLLAKALNCEKKLQSTDSYEPCNECLSCKEIMQDKSLDVIEIDAASNRGIDEIRELREKIKFAPSRSKYKVYIIDEVHMLTKEAFNALLKTLEEPPKHAIFIMATTELHKIPATILSRVQSFNFRRAGLDGIIKYLKRIAESEKINIEDNALRVVAMAGDGSYRDATSVLDQVVSLGHRQITLSDVQEILGLAKEKTIENFLEFIFGGKKEEALNLINQVFSEGYDIEDFSKKIIEYLRKIMIFKAIPVYLEKAELTNEQKTALVALSQKIDKDKILPTLNIFIEASVNVKSSSIPQLPLELAVMEIIDILGVERHDQDIKPVEKKEEIIEIKPSIEKIKVSVPPPEIKKLENPAKNSVTVDAITIKNKWPEVLAEIQPENRSLYLILKECEPRDIKGNKLVLAVKFKIYEERITAKKNYKILAESLERVLGKSHELAFFVDENINGGDGGAENNQDLVKDAMEVFEI